LTRNWRQGLSDEVWFAEIQCLSPTARASLPAQDVEASERYFVALGRAQAGRGGRKPPAGTLSWFDFVEKRLPDGYLDHPQLKRSFHRLYQALIDREGRSAISADYDPGQLVDTAEKPVDRVLYQHGQNLQIVPVRAPALSDGAPLATFSARTELVINELAEEDNPAKFWQSGQAPSWADKWGTDTYGPWVEFSIPSQQGDPINQRMRWIAPGRAECNEAQHV